MDAAETPSLRHRLLQGAAVLIALVVLYALGVGPAAYLATKTARGRHFLVEVYNPLFVAIEHTPLDMPVRAYLNWWYRLAESQPAP